MDESYISNPAGILTVLCGVGAIFFWLEERTKAKLFNYFPPLVFIYALPAVMSNTGVLSNSSPVYDWLGTTMLPMFLVMMLLKVDVASTVRIMGRGVFVMLFGTAGVVLGAPIAFLIAKNKLPAESWKAFGSLAGSWIGGTGNMAAVSKAIEASPEDFGLAVLGDNLVYMIWLPILLGSKSLAKRFNHLMRVDDKRIHTLENTRVAGVSPARGKGVSPLFRFDRGRDGLVTRGRDALDTTVHKGNVKMRHFLYLFVLAFSCTWAADAISGILPEVEPVLTASSWKILLITTLGLLLSLTPARHIPASHELAMALLYIFVANMGAKADVSKLTGSAAWFIIACYIWIAIHGSFCLFGAYLLKVDIHSTAIASAANIGGAGSAPVVASHHNKKLVPVSILMALLGYAIGNYAAFAAAWMCSKLSG